MPTLLDTIRKKYTVLCRFSNCGEIFDVSIPKGITIDKYFGDGAGVCSICGCNTLQRAIEKDESKKEKQHDAKNKKMFG